VVPPDSSDGDPPKGDQKKGLNERLAATIDDWLAIDEDAPDDTVDALSGAFITVGDGPLLESDKLPNEADPATLETVPKLAAFEAADTKRVDAAPPDDDADELPEVEPVAFVEVEPFAFAEVEPIEYRAANRENAQTRTVEVEPARDVVVERDWETTPSGRVISVHNATTLELPREVADLSSAPALTTELKRYLERILELSPGPGGVGPTERLAIRSRPERVPDTILSARYLRARDTELGGISLVEEQIDLVRALVDAVADTRGVPVLLTGPAGSGKSHACNSLAATLARAFLDAPAGDNAFSGMTSRLLFDGTPVPVRFDLATVATLQLAHSDAMIEAYVEAGEFPRELLTHSGPVVLIADNLSTALSMGGDDYNPFELLCGLLVANSNWRAVVASRPLPDERLLSFARFGRSVPIIDIRPMRKAQSVALLDAWRHAGLAAPDAETTETVVPAAIGSNPRLLQMLAGGWRTFGDDFSATVMTDGVAGACRLLLDSICTGVDQAAGTTSHRQDLQIVAEVVSMSPERYVSLGELHELISEGYIRSELEALVAGGIIELRVAKGERTVGAVVFTHALLREVLHAERLIEDLTRIALASELQARARSLDDSESPTAYSERDILRVVEVARNRVRGLRSHLRTALGDALRPWIIDEARADDRTAGGHLARMLGVACLLHTALVRGGSGDVSPIPEETLGAIARLLTESGETALEDAVSRDWTGPYSAATRTSGKLTAPE